MSTGVRKEGSSTGSLLETEGFYILDMEKLFYVKNDLPIPLLRANKINVVVEPILILHILTKREVRLK